MLAIIPLRGGSKGIPGKNIKEIAGKPLCQWAIDAAKKSGIFGRIIVSTDSTEIADIVAEHNGTEVDIMIRPGELARDDTPTEAVMLHVAETEDFQTMCLIQATAPLTTPYDFRSARSKFLSWGVDSLVTVTELKKFVWEPTYHNFTVNPLNYEPRKRPMRENISPVYVETGNFYFTKRWVLEKLHSRLGGYVGRYIVAPEAAIDIDDMNDFERAEELLRGRSN